MNEGKRPLSRLKIALFAAALLVSGASAVAQTVSSTSKTDLPPPAGMPDLVQGYIPQKDVPDSRSVLPPAPAVNSATQVRDDAAAAAARRLAGSARWKLATQDADLSFPHAASDFSCALGVNISPETTPHLYTLLRRSMADAGLSTYPTKREYQRMRPFMVEGGAVCTPDEIAQLRKDGSYPSGHSAIGWTWALILVELDPARENAILARGRSFMESRVICNVHWLSDTEAGAMMGSAIFARLQDEPKFQTDLKAAREEIAHARALGQVPKRNCAAQAAVLASTPLTLP